MRSDDDGDGGNVSMNRNQILMQSRTGRFLPKMNPKSDSDSDEDNKIFSRGRDHFLNELSSRKGLEGSTFKSKQ